MSEKALQGYQRLPETNMGQGWAQSGVELDDKFLRIEGHAVMERWETPFMHELARVSMLNGGAVLEVGFGMGISATGIQKYGPTRHLIIEFNQAVIDKEGKSFAAAHPSVEILAGDWKDVMGSIADNSLDGVLYDTYPMNKQEQHLHQFPFIQLARPKLRTGGVLTYCNLTSLGLLYSKYEKELGADKDKIWEAIWRETQVPNLLKAGWTADELAYHIFTLPQDAIEARGNCEYYSHATCLVPLLTKKR